MLPSKVDEPWISDEPRLARVARDVIVRALHRPALVLTLALLVTGAFVALRALRTPTYVATLHFRIAESNLTDRLHAPRPPHAIREYVRNVALSRDRVERIMTEHRWFGPGVARERAIEEFRDDVEIEVTRNYFLLDRGQDGSPRSALLAMSLRGYDGIEALGILHEIGNAILEGQAEYRAARLAGSRALVDAELERTRVRSRSLQARLGSLERELAGAQAGRAASIASQIAARRFEAKVATEQILALERLASGVKFSAAAEGERLGLSFEMFDESVVPHSPRLGPFRAAGLAFLVLALALLVTLLFVGSFDDRIYTPADLVSRGIAIFGTLRRFPGDDVWAHRGRATAREG